MPLTLYIDDQLIGEGSGANLQADAGHGGGGAEPLDQVVDRPELGCQRGIQRPVARIDPGVRPDGGAGIYGVVHFANLAVAVVASVDAPPSGALS